MDENSVMNDSRKENVVLSRNREAVRVMLLTTRLPSMTTAGREEKLESINTSCETCRAASLPAAMAIEQSASLSASTSLTPSPTMATVCPCALSA